MDGWDEKYAWEYPYLLHFTNTVHFAGMFDSSYATDFTFRTQVRGTFISEYILYN